MMPRTSFVLLFLLITSYGRAQKLVMPGDHADPSVVKVGDTYWASATTSNWMPAFPLLKSTNLTEWETVGHVFKELPAWADYYFWAPEISYENGKFYVYYAAHKKGGNLCVGIASADKPEGPYKDHGPIICEEAGSIDAFPMRDEKGKLHIIWKEDGNSVGKPTPIWIQELNEERTAVLGNKRELFRNDAPWEGALVEGVSMMKHGDYLYAFYAAAGCCGIGCDYQSGVARSKSLTGPWEKFSNNPVLVNEAGWRCPGHGTPIEKDGRYYFLYHAYDSTGSVYTGRQGLIKEFVFTNDNWIKFVDAPTAAVAAISLDVKDYFKGRVLDKNWQWSVFQKPEAEVGSGRLVITSLPDGEDAIIAQKTFTANYRAVTRIHRQSSDAAAGIALVGDEKNKLAAFINGNSLEIIQTRNGKDSVLLVTAMPRKRKSYLGMQVLNGKDVSFSIGKKSRSMNMLQHTTINGAYLPPWDRALRVALIAKGKPGTKAAFGCFEMHAIDQ